MKIQYLFAACLLIAFGCKKGPKLQPPIPVNTNGLLTRTIRLDTDYYPTKYIYEEYRYDLSDRVQRYIKYEVDSSGVGPVHKDTIQVITFDYIPGNNTKLPDFSLENYRTPFYHLINAGHQYFYDNQGRMILDTLLAFYNNSNDPSTTDRGVVVARHVHYNGSSITVDNTNLDLFTLQQGIYHDSINLDPAGNVISTSTLDGRYFVTGNRDDFRLAGYFKDNFTYSTIENPLHRLSVSNIMAFVQTGFNGGAFYASYFSKNALSSSSDTAPGIVNAVTTNFKYTTDPANMNLIKKISFSRPGANQHGGYEVFTYNTHF